MDELELTNEEAITIIKNEFSKFADTLSVYAEKRKIAFDKAIEALKTQPFINKFCISEGVCHEDKMQVLDKLRADVINLKHDVDIVMYGIAIDDVLGIIDKYRTEESEDDANEN